MNTKACRRCFKWADSPEIVLEILSNRFHPCEGCEQQPVFRMLAQQYELNQPRWWVINGVHVVPIWVVDVVKKRFNF